MAPPVRVRFAPSPTGDPHLGNSRTALFNWLFARHHGGTFVLRVEDTDQQRTQPEALAAILESLRWLGLDWDEGPSEASPEGTGPYAPYHQSMRFPLYHTFAEQLRREGKLYPCFCTPQELDEMRREQQRQKRPPGYNGRCRDLPDGERARRVEQGTPYVLRFRTPQEDTTTLQDLIRGEVVWENRLLDDFVALKSDGFPTYHLANVIDDHAMEITHVLRAEEWLPSAPRHLMLYDALGWAPPLFAHLPMILGPDRAKLSKRHGATSTLAYRDDGYLPEAMVNFLALLGWSLDDRTEFFSRAELVEHFTIERVTRSAAIFNAEKLTWMNGAYLRGLAPDALATRLVPFLERPEAQLGLPDSVDRPLDMAYLREVIPAVQERLKKLGEGPEVLGFFFETTITDEAVSVVQKGTTEADTHRALTVTLERLEALTSWEEGPLEHVLRPLADELGLKTGQLFGAVRVAVTGRTAAPPLFETLRILGRERSLARLRSATERLERG